MTLLLKLFNRSRPNWITGPGPKSEPAIKSESRGPKNGVSRWRRPNSDIYSQNHHFGLVYDMIHQFILPPRTPDIIAHWQVAPPARPPSRWLPHMILTEPCCSFHRCFDMIYILIMHLRGASFILWLKSRVLLRNEVGMIMVYICLHGVISWSKASGRGRFGPTKTVIDEKYHPPVFEFYST